MHCNMKPPDVTQVVLDFNYEAHNALAYKFNTFKPRRSCNVPASNFSTYLRLSYSDFGNWEFWAPSATLDGFQSFCGFHRPMMYPYTKFQQNLTICKWVIIRWPPIRQWFSEVNGPIYNKSGQNINRSLALPKFFAFQYAAAFWNKGDR